MATKKSMKKNEARAEKAGAPLEEVKKNMFRELVEVLMYGLSLLMFCKGFVWQNFQIPTSSMENNLLIGDHITANTFMFKGNTMVDRALFPMREIKRGDVLVFKYPGNERQNWIKRCIGLPGDRIEISQDRVYINGERLQENYPFYKQPRRIQRDPTTGYRPEDYYEIKPGMDNAQYIKVDMNLSLANIRAKTERTLRMQRSKNPETYSNLMERLNAGDGTTIPEGFYFMMGDNRNHSDDSRSWGFVPREMIQGRAWFVWWSYGEDLDSHKLTGWPLIKSYLRVPFTIWTRTHFPETFSFIK